MKKRILFLLSLFAGLCFRSCSSNDIAGGTDVGNSDKIVGVVVDEIGVVQSGVQVTLFPHEYNPVEDGPLPDSHKLITDSTGRYLFMIDNQRIYNLDLFNPDTKARCLRAGVCGESLNVDIPVDTLRSPGVIKVILPSGTDTTRGYVYIEGTDIYKKVISKTVYLDVVPSGVIPKIIYTSTTDKVTLIDSMNVNSGDTAVQTLALYISSKKYDTLGVISGIVTEKLREFGISTRIIFGSDFEMSDTIGMNAVIISPPADSLKKLMNLLRTAPIPLITMEVFSVVGLAMSDSSSGNDTVFGVIKNQIMCDIVNSTHLISGNLSGSVSIYSDTGKVEWARPTGGAVKIAIVSGHPDKSTIFCYEKGSDMSDLKAPAKRGGFFIVGEGVNVLTDEWWYMYGNMIKWLFE